MRTIKEYKDLRENIDDPKEKDKLTKLIDNLKK